MIRVLMVFTILNRGGAETMVMNYLRRIDRSKVIFDFLVHREERGAYENEIESLGGRIYRLPPISLLNLGDYKRQVSLFFDKHPEYQLIHGHCSELGYWIYKEAYRRGVRFIAAHGHNVPVGFELKMPFRNALKYLMRPYLTDYMACGKDASRWLFGKKLSETSILLPNAVDAVSFSENYGERESIRAEMEWGKQFVLINVARFSQQKNHLFMLSVFKELLHYKTNSLLILVGGHGETEQMVRDRVAVFGLSDRVRFLGGRDDVVRLLRGADLFLMPSLFEGLPVSLVEAQASGIKVVASTNVPGESQIIADGIDFLSLKLSPKEWAIHIAQYKDGYNRRDTYEEIVNAGFDIKKNAEWLQNYYIEKSQH